LDYTIFFWLGNKIIRVIFLKIKKEEKYKVFIMVNNKRQQKTQKA